MKENWKLKYRVNFFIILLVVIDWISKFLARSRGVFVLNQGVSFGWFSETKILTLVILIMLGVMITKKGIWTNGEKLILAGGLANLADRFIFGGVTDWIRVGDLWFNLADTYISIGVAMLFTAIIL